jgi:hypothetical protein
LTYSGGANIELRSTTTTKNEMAPSPTIINTHIKQYEPYKSHPLPLKQTLDAHVTLYETQECLYGLWIERD